jgi:hypothetical protein
MMGMKAMVCRAAGPLESILFIVDYWTVEEKK